MTNSQLTARDLPDIEEAIFERHPKRFLNKKLLSKLLAFIPLLIAAIALNIWVDHYMIPWIVYPLWLGLLLFALFISYKEYFVRGYILRENDITYKQGWIFYHETTVPFNRIQHTEIKDGPIDRIFNLRELEIYTAGGSTSDLSLSGLDPHDAVKIKNYIASQTSFHA